MAEVQKSTEAGEMTRNFVQFLLMQQQQALLAMGRHPNAPAGAPPANPALGKALLDQLSAVKTKCAGNLDAEEQGMFDRIVKSLQLVYAEVSAKP